MAIINDAIGGLQRRFRSLFNTNTGSANGHYFFRTSKNRGYLIRKRDTLNTVNLEKGYVFQFNPQQLMDTKSSTWSTRNYPGLSYNDYVWAGGGERIVTFELMLDDTPGSHTTYFLPDTVAATIKNTPVPAAAAEQKRNRDMLATAFGVPTIPTSKETAKVTQMVDFEWDMNGAFSVTRVHERGVLDAVEYLQSFLYPEPLKDENTPRFAEGGIISLNQFRPPATAVFSFGPILLQGIIKSAPVTYQLFDRDLTPIRASVSVELGVLEFEDLTSSSTMTRKI